jgi:hypothetical protein
MWQCKKCREKIEDAFAVCWKCGTSRDGVEDPSFQRVDEASPVEPDLASDAQPLALPSVPAPRQAQRQTLPPCPKCGSPRVIPGVRVLDRDGEYSDKSLSVRLDRNPDALLFKGSEVVELRANVCGRCGYTELYVTDPQALWSAYQEQAKP